MRRALQNTIRTGSGTRFFGREDLLGQIPPHPCVDGAISFTSSLRVMRVTCLQEKYEEYVRAIASGLSALGRPELEQKLKQSDTQKALIKSTSNTKLTPIATNFFTGRLKDGHQLMEVCNLSGIDDKLHSLLRAFKTHYPHEYRKVIEGDEKHLLHIQESLLTQETNFIPDALYFYRQYFQLQTLRSQTQRHDTQQMLISIGEKGLISSEECCKLQGLLGKQIGVLQHIQEDKEVFVLPTPPSFLYANAGNAPKFR